MNAELMAHEALYNERLLRAMRGETLERQVHSMGSHAMGQSIAANSKYMIAAYFAPSCIVHARIANIFSLEYQRDFSPVLVRRMQAHWYHPLFDSRFEPQWFRSPFLHLHPSTTHSFNPHPFFPLFTTLGSV
jgi:hypothetical protein